MRTKKLTLAIIDAAKELGLAEDDIKNAKNLFENMEYGLAFDTILTQLYEYEFEIDNEFYELIKICAMKMNLAQEDYAFMHELVRSEKSVPLPVKERLSKVLSSLGSED